MRNKKRLHFLGFYPGLGYSRTLLYEASLKEEQVIYAETVLKVLAYLTHYSEEVIIKPSRNGVIVRLRWIFGHFLLHFGLSSNQASVFMCSERKNLAQEHSTLIYAKKHFPELLKDGYYQNIINHLIEYLKNPQELLLGKLQHNNPYYTYFPFDVEQGTYDRNATKFFGVPEKKVVQAERILKIINHFMHISPENVVGTSKKRDYFTPRLIYMVIMCRNLKFEPAIACKFLMSKKMGKSKNRTTVLHMLKTHDDFISIHDREYVSCFEKVYQAFLDKEMITEKEDESVFLIDKDVENYFFDSDEVERILQFNGAKFIPPKVRDRIQKHFSLEELRKMGWICQAESLRIPIKLMTNPQFFIDKIQTMANGNLEK